jgi:hypothetical protein
MFYGEHLNAEEVAVNCPCGIAATVEVFNARKISCGWYCRNCSYRKRKELRKQEQIAGAIVRKGSRRYG